MKISRRALDEIVRQKVTFSFGIEPDPVVVLAWRLCLIYRLGRIEECLKALLFEDERVR